MNRKLLVLGCSQTKRDAVGLLPAIDRYDGSAYRVLRNYLRKREWPSDFSVAILSAKYGLVGGFTSIENYDERMTARRAKEWAPRCSLTLENWAREHNRFYFALGKDYLPAVLPSFDRELKGKAEVFQGPIGMKLSQIKGLLQDTKSPTRHKPILPPKGSGKLSYFLPDWDDLLDENFNFELDTFSGSSRKERGDKHCCILMKPKRMCDGVLVSLAQHLTSKGPLRKIMGTEAISLAPKNLREQFGLSKDQILFGDCGAFSYVNDEQPAISVERAIALYDLHGFDLGASVDHIPATKIVRNGVKTQVSDSERLNRVRVTMNNAEEFIFLSRKRNAQFMPVGIVQALDPESYAKTVEFYHKIGYQYIAIGGLVPLTDRYIEEIVSNVMNTVAKLKNPPYIHLFGIFRPKLQSIFRKLNVDSFDSASYFRKAWLRSDQNYLAPNGEWYAALRVPMTSDGRTRKKLEESGLDLDKLQTQEEQVLDLLCKFDRDDCSIHEVLNALLDYDQHLLRTSDINSLRPQYMRTLRDRPWRSCDCPFCQKLGIHNLVFRGANRNKRRGAHNTLMLYESVRG